LRNRRRICYRQVCQKRYGALRITKGAFKCVTSDGDTTSDIFLRDLQANTITLGSGAGVKGNGSSSHASVSTDGRFVDPRKCRHRHCTERLPNESPTTASR